MTRERTNNDLGSPAWLLERVRQVGPIVYDPCSNDWTEATVNAPHVSNIDRGQDGLSTTWSAFGGLVYVNCPYGRGHLPRWSEKIALEAARGCEIISLVPCSPDTAWWETLRETCNARCDVAMRIAFEGGEHGTGQIKSEVFYHGPNRFLFCHAFDSLGECIPYPRRRAA